MLAVVNASHGAELDAAVVLALAFVPAIEIGHDLSRIEASSTVCKAAKNQRL